MSFEVFLRYFILNGFKMFYVILVSKDLPENHVM